MDLVQRILSISEVELARLVGRKLEENRHYMRIRQSDLAKQIGISIPTYKRMVEGEGKLTNYIAAMKAIDYLEFLEPLFYKWESDVAPVNGKDRRVRPKIGKPNNQPIDNSPTLPDMEDLDYTDDMDEDDW